MPPAATATIDADALSDTTLALEDDQLELLRCEQCGLAWTRELFEGGEAELSCPRCSDDDRETPLAPTGGVERRPYVRGGTVRETYLYDPESSRWIGFREPVPGGETVRWKKARHGVYKSLVRELKTYR